MAPTAGDAQGDACQIDGGPCANRRCAARRHRVSDIRWGAPLVLALVVLTTACNGLPPPRCEIDNVDDRMVSTREVFLERLAGCPVGGPG